MNTQQLDTIIHDSLTATLPEGVDVEQGNYQDAAKDGYGVKHDPYNFAEADHMNADGTASAPVELAPLFDVVTAPIVVDKRDPIPGRPDFNPEAAQVTQATVIINQFAREVAEKVKALGRVQPKVFVPAVREQHNELNQYVFGLAAYIVYKADALPVEVRAAYEDADAQGARTAADVVPSGE